MRVYLAADSKMQNELRFYREYLQSRGITVTSRWLDMELENPSTRHFTEPELQDAAVHDLNDVDNAHILVAFNPERYHKQGTGGRHVEFGYAIAKCMPIVYVGEKKENIFHRHPRVRAWVDTVYSDGDPEYIAHALHMALVDVGANYMGQKVSTK